MSDRTIVALAVDSDGRTALVPDVPTMAELGYRENLSRVYYGLVAPVGVPKPIIDRLRSEVAAIMAEPEFRRKLVLDRALEPVANSPEEFAEFLAKDRVVSARNVSQAGLTLQ